MRNVIVTGGSRGLGLGIARTLSAAGYRVIAVARRESAELREARAGAVPGAIEFHACDLAQTAGLGHFVGELKKRYGGFYGLINNAGLGTAGVLATLRDERIAELVQLNTVAPLVLTKYVLRPMMIARIGRIVNISSIVSATGYSGLSAYAATKAALIGFTRSLAREVGSLEITVNAVAPGFTDTEMTRELGDAEREKIVRRSALRRLVGVEDVAAAVEFLLSEKARNITGTTLTVDAGNTA